MFHVYEERGHMHMYSQLHLYLFHHGFEKLFSSICVFFLTKTRKLNFCLGYHSKTTTRTPKTEQELNAVPVPIEYLDHFIWLRKRKWKRKRKKRCISKESWRNGRVWKTKWLNSRNSNSRNEAKLFFEQMKNVALVLGR